MMVQITTVAGHEYTMGHDETRVDTVTMTITVDRTTAELLRVGLVNAPRHGLSTTATRIIAAMWRSLHMVTVRGARVDVQEV